MDKKLTIKIVPFRPEGQKPVRNLILAGLEEYWGALDESKNPDLRNIAESYENGVFLVAWLDNEIVGTGAFIPRVETAEIVRMSVAQRVRRQGIGQQILKELCCRAYQRGFNQVILETTATWKNAIEFYKTFGFQITHFSNGDMYFSLDLQDFFENRSSAHLEFEG